jgi:hypothetical protein
MEQSVSSICKRCVCKQFTLVHVLLRCSRYGRISYTIEASKRHIASSNCCANVELVLLSEKQPRHCCWRFEASSRRIDCRSVSDNRRSLRCVVEYQWSSSQYFNFFLQSTKKCCVAFTNSHFSLQLVVLMASGEFSKQFKVPTLELTTRISDLPIFVREKKFVLKQKIA